MGVYQRNERWMVFYHDQQGKRKDKSFGKGNGAHQKAEQFDKAIKNTRKSGWKISIDEVIQKFSESDKRSGEEVRRVESELQVNAPDKRGVTFEQLCNAYLDDLSISGRSAKHIHEVRLVMNSCYYQRMDKNKDVEQFSYLVDIAPFIKSLYGVSTSTGKQRSQKTINKYGDYLSSIFNFGIRVGLISQNPVKSRKKGKEEPRTVQLTVADIKKIMNAALPHIKWAMEVCFNLGTRSGESELLSMKWEHVDFDKKEVLIYGRKTKQYRKVPVTESFLARLEEMKAVAKSEYIIEYKGKQVKKIAKGFRAACAKAGVTYPVRMYDLRHMFATTMLANGADLAAVSKLMGHSRITMTADVYYQCMQGEKERAVKLLPSLSAL